METKRRSLAKAISWRFIALAVTTAVGFLMTGSAKFAVSIGVADSMIKILAYYLHERTWTSIDYGRMRPPEYEI